MSVRYAVTGGALSAAVLASVSWFLLAGPGGADGQQAALGRELYAIHCAGCHGASLEGQPNWQNPLPDGKMPAPPLNATGHAPHHPEPELFRVVKEGMESVSGGRASDMPGFTGVLSDDEIRAVLAFIQTSW